MLRNNYTSLKAVSTWLSIYQTALSLFEKKGYHNTTIRMITSEANCSLGSFYRYFGSKEEIILALYENISEQLEQFLLEIPEGKIADRFSYLMEKKIEIITPYKKLFSATVGFMMDSENKIGIVGKETEVIRLKNRTIFKALVEGATDKPKTGYKVDQLTNALYGIHFAILFLWFVDKTENKTNTFSTLKKVGGLLKLLNRFKPISNYLFGMLDKTFSNTLQIESSKNIDLAKQILSIVFKYRKTSSGHETCQEQPCEQCATRHLNKINFFIQKEKPIHFVLPAFPAKSPNKKKVLGTLPDLGEEIALQTLQEMCNQIKLIYPPGAKMSICSDGRVFSDIVQVSDEDVSDYAKSLKQFIVKQKLKDLELLNLEDFIKTDNDFDLARKKLLYNEAQSIEHYESLIKNHPHYEQLFNGIHRFIIEDQRDLFPELSKTQFKKYAKNIAVQVMQRSDAWGTLINSFYPVSLRLSIHPHHPHSEKIGVKITKAEDNWITPWHGVVILKPDEGYVLGKQADAIRQGATLVIKDGKPHYYSLAHEN